MPLTPLRIVGFRSYSELPLWIAQSNGFFTRENLDVTLAALDNVIAYDEGQTTTELSNPPDFVAIMGGDSGSLKLWVRPEIGGYADLHGKTFAVDAPSTGFSFILRRMLAEHGLNAGDYRFDAVGNTERRFALMQAGPASSGAQPGRCSRTEPSSRAPKRSRCSPTCSIRTPAFRPTVRSGPRQRARCCSCAARTRCRRRPSPT